MTTPPVDPAKLAAETRSAVLKAARDALPVAKSTPLTGATDAGDGSGYLARWTARIALTGLARTIADDIGTAARKPVPTPDGAPSPGPGGPPTVVRILLTQDGSAGERDVVRTTVLRILTAHRAGLHSAVAALLAADDGLAPATGGPRVPADSGRSLLRGFGGSGEHGSGAPLFETLSSQLASAADVVGLLRSEFSVHSSPVAARTAELVVAVAQQLIQRVGPPAVQVVLDGLNLGSSAGPVTGALDAALRSDGELAVALAIVQAHRSEFPDDDVRPAVAIADEALAAGAAARNSWAAALAGLTETPESGPPMLGVALLADQLHDPQFPITHIAQLTLDSSGTDSITRTSLFGPSGRLRLVGGVTASWLLVATGHPVLLGAGTRHQGWTTGVDLRTGAAVGSAMTDEPEPATSSGQPRLPPLDEIASRLLLGGLGVAGIAWLVLDALTKTR